VCRHRGALVATAPRRRGTLQCPYHAWTYGLDGALRAAPRSELEPCFDAGELGLRPVGVGTWGPFVFVNPDPDAEPLTAALGDLPEVVAAHGLDVGALRYHRRVSYELRANWKVALENYLECYHCAINHPGFVEAIDERALRLESGATRLSQFAPVHPRALRGEAAYDARGALSDSQFHLLLPATKLNVCPGPPNLSIGPVWPLATDRCAGWLDYFFAPGTDDAWIAGFTAWDDQVGAEDVALVEGVQEGISSGAIEDGRLLAASEALIAAFQDHVRGRVEAALR
jgi:choline monooxygenase